METELKAASLTGPADSSCPGGIREVLALSTGLLPESARRHLVAGLERLEQRRFNLVVVGEFKRGKSTLINALLGRELLPSGVVPLTSAVTILRGGERNRMEVRFEDGRTEEHALAELAGYATERGNPENREGVEEVIVELDHGLLAGGLQLIDTPGIGSIHDHNTEVAESFLPQVDAALCVLAADQPFSAEERRFFQRAGESAPRLIFALNKLDLLSPEERAEAVEFIRGSLGADQDPDVELYSVSAKQGEGIDELVDRLRELAAEEGESLVFNSVQGLAAALAEDAANAAELERGALGLPLDQLEERIRMFEERAERLRSLGTEAGDLLESNAKRLVRDRLNEPLMSYAKQYGPELVRELETYVEQRPGDSPGGLADALEAWIAKTISEVFRELASRYESEIGEGVMAIERQYAERVQQLLAELEQAAHEAFGGEAAERLCDVGLREPPRFSFKLKDAEHMLDRLVRVGRRSLPGRIGRRLVLSDARDRLLQMTDRHAGRLRSELAERTMTAVRDYQEDLEETVATAEESILLAIDRARTERHRGEARTATRMEELASLSDRLAGLARELREGNVTMAEPARASLEKEDQHG
jgi:small GTP-binding protein